ncbi:hypothetical protein D3C80_1569750 [compost metagenome]
MTAFLNLAGQVLDTGVVVQVIQTAGIAAQATSIEHGLPGLLVKMLPEGAEQLAELL